MQQEARLTRRNLPVATRDGAQREMIVKALKMGCDVITEKPMATDERKCQTIQSEVPTIPWGAGGHFGGDPQMQRMIFIPDTPDPLRQRAGSRAGAMSALTGVAAVKSVDTGKPVLIADSIRL